MASVNVRAAAYVRVSTLLNQDPQNQLVHIKAFAKARSFDLIQEYVDQGVSGAKERRPALDQMIKDSRMGKFKVIIIMSLDRLGRNTRHMLNLLHELHGYGVAIVSLTEQIDMSTPVGQATLTILSAVSQLERQIISERIRNALAAKKLSKAGWRCGRPPIVTPDVSTRAQELRSQGHSIRQIGKALGVSKTSVLRALKKCP